MNDDSREGHNMPPRTRHMSSRLFKAVSECQYTKLKFLLGSGADPSVTDARGQNLLVAALHIPDPGRCDKMFRFLLRRGVDTCHVDVTSGRDVLSWACALGCTEQVRQILDSALGELDLSRWDREGLTALHHATSWGDVHTVRLLVQGMSKYHISVDIPDREGLTPYICARRLGHVGVADVLEREGNCSTDQFDIHYFRTGQAWDAIGRKERERRLKHERRQERIHNKIRGQTTERPMLITLPRLVVSEPTSSKLKTKLSSIMHSSDTVHSPRHVDFTDRDSGIGVSSDDNSTDHSSALPPIPSRSHGLSFLHRKSMDTAFALMGFQAKNSMDVRHPDSFVASQLDTSKATEYSSVLDNISSMMDIAAEQQSDAFRTVARPRTPPRVQARPPEVQGQRKKVSTMAILFGRDKKRKATYPTGKRRTKSVSPNKKKSKKDKRR